ncbi:hypothetical protein GPDM_04649 [Planococcus donghaensis MPA1U2]|uniref:Uncharacterized protein n=1 Tax=Planococcus donghaensis MPA1U2 TaxID=933115 RepID=E7REP0_9BACL|nr:hypothetical protein [Planococcus donghaensis]EGA90621.1 hypothetical protein GPDM_04649 [Planococcus donghaensis MPA1U2]
MILIIAIAHKKKLLSFWSVTIAVIFIAIGGWLLKPESQEAKNLKDELTTIVNEQVGAISNMDKTRVSSIVVSKSSGGWDVELSLNADKGFTMISTKQLMWQNAIKILASASEIDQLHDISLSWVYPVINEQKSIEDKSVMSFTIDKDTRDQIVWGNLEPSVLPDLVYDYEEHPILSE